ncbi:MAG: acyl-CoA dehydrogenase family protein [Chloroflexi bacterium]|nr:acyl-CoA dehydrogenase family protein [Chloroflexota bacterium]
MDFAFDEVQTLFQNAARDFATREVAPIVEEAEKKDDVPMELFTKLGELGYLCPGYPEEYGGGDLGKIGECILYEELGKISSGICSGIMVNGGLATKMVADHGTEEQKQKYLAAACRGEKIAAFGLTEANAGSDAAAIETKAVKDGDSYVINGSKFFITNGQICSFVTIAAVTDKSKGSKGISTIVVDADTPGFTRTKMEKLGNHASATSEMYFDDCRVPVENLVGEEGQGFKYMLQSLTGARISHSARSIGLAQVALQATIDYANERVQFGKPIGKNQDIAFRLARISTEIEAARWLLYRVAWLYDQGEDCRKEAAMTKLKSSEVAVRMAEEAMRIHAGAGYLAESVIQRYYRDAILYPITEGTSEIQQLIISRELGL